MEVGELKELMELEELWELEELEELDELVILTSEGPMGGMEHYIQGPEIS